MRLRFDKRYRVVAGAVAVTLFVVGAVAHAPPHRGGLSLSAGAVRAVAPAEVKVDAEVYALVDEVIGRAGVRPRAGWGDRDRRGEPEALAEAKTGDDESAPPAAGVKRRVISSPPIRMRPLTAEPVFVGHAGSPPSRTPPLMKDEPRYGGGLGLFAPPPSSRRPVEVAVVTVTPPSAGPGPGVPPTEPPVSTTPEDPTITPTPPGAEAPGAGAPVPEPGAGLVAFAGGAVMFLRRRR